MSGDIQTRQRRKEKRKSKKGTKEFKNSTQIIKGN